MTETAAAARPNAILAVLAFAGIVTSLMQTLVVPLIGELPQLLHTSAADAGWVITTTLLVAAVSTPVAGRLGDLFGKRRIMLVSTVPLIVGSAMCALATSLLPMIIGRGLQGMGVGIVPLAISVLRDLLPPERLGSGIALISSSLGIGGALGLPLAAFVAQNSSWRVLFWGAAVLSGVIAILIVTVVPDPPIEARGRFDAIGAVGLGAALVSLLLAVSKGASWGWTSPTIIGLFAATVVILLAWGSWELRSRYPLVDLRVTARPQVLLTNAASVVIGIAMYSQSLILPQLLQLPRGTGYGLGQSMTAMGLWMAPAGVMMMLISPVGARLSALRGPKVTLITGSLIIAMGYGLSPLLTTSAWGVLATTSIISTGVGFAYGSLPALIMGAVPLSETAAANSFNTLMRSVGTSISAAVVGAILAQMSTHLGGVAIPTEEGLHLGMLIGAGVALAAAIIAMAIPARRTGIEAIAGPRLAEPAVHSS